MFTSSKRDLGWDNSWRHFGNYAQSRQEKVTVGIHEVTSQVNPTQSPLFLGREPGRGEFYELWKATEFFHIGDQCNKEIYLREQIWGLVAL